MARPKQIKNLTPTESKARKADLVAARKLIETDVKASGKAVAAAAKEHAAVAKAAGAVAIKAAKDADAAIKAATKAFDAIKKASDKVAAASATGFAKIDGQLAELESAEA
jgi:hypothetical protein